MNKDRMIKGGFLPTKTRTRKSIQKAMEDVKKSELTNFNFRVNYDTGAIELSGVHFNRK